MRSRRRSFPAHPPNRRSWERPDRPDERQFEASSPRLVSGVPEGSGTALMNASSSGGRSMGQVELAIALDGLGCEQHSVVTWNQLLAAGATPAWVKQQVQFGHLIRLAPRTYRFNGVARDWKMRASAALLSARAPALISHRSAAWLHGIDEHMPGIIDITVPRHRRPRARPGVQFHESRLFDVAAETAGVRDGLAVTGVARTILDSCAVVRGLPGRLDLLDEARRHKLVDWDQLWECLVIHTGRGRPGLKGYRDVLLTWDGIAPAGTLLFPGDTPEPPSQHDASGS